MDRFIVSALTKSKSLHFYLKSNMDRFIDNVIICLDYDENI